MQFGTHRLDLPDKLAERPPLFHQPAVAVEQVEVISGLEQREVLSLPVNVYQALADLLEDRQRHDTPVDPADVATAARSEEHTSELQSRENLVCRLLLEKKNKR